jgi:hypothetical protein
MPNNRAEVAAIRRWPRDSGLSRREKPGSVPNTLTVWKQITTEFFGRRISAAYVIEDAMLKVKTPGGERGAQLRSSNPDQLAERLLRELAAQGKA